MDCSRYKPESKLAALRRIVAARFCCASTIRTGFAVAVVIVFTAIPSFGQEPYRRVTLPGIQTVVKEYVVVGSWHVTCYLQTSGRGKGGRWCELQAVTGERYPRTGNLKLADGLVVDIWNLGGMEPRHVNVKISYNAHRGSLLEAGAGAVTLSKTVGPGPMKYWDHEDALKIIPELIGENTVRWKIVWPKGDQRSGVTSLRGFGKAWKYAVKFTGYDPLN